MGNSQDSSVSENGAVVVHETLSPIIREEDKPKIKQSIFVILSFSFIMYIFVNSFRHDHKPDLKLRSLTAVDLGLFAEGLGLHPTIYSANSATLLTMVPKLQSQCPQGHLPNMSPVCGADGCLKTLKGTPRLVTPIDPEVIDIIRRIYGYTNIIHFSVVRHISQMQWNFGIYGSVGEIGVYEGKFTSMLAVHLAPEFEERLFICDTFKDYDHLDDEVKEANLETFEEHMKKLNYSVQSKTEPLRIRMWDDRSVFLSKAVYVQMELPAFRLYSLHGSTDPNDILFDLQHVSCVLRDGGVVILHEEVESHHNFTRSPLREFISLYGQNILLPFLRTHHKLYICPSEWHSKYVSYIDKRGIAEKLNLCSRSTSEFGPSIELYAPCAVDKV